MVNNNITKKHAFSKDEYTSLRSELIARIGMINSQSHSAILTIVSTWVAGITILVFISGSTFRQLGAAGSLNNIEYIDLMGTFIFLIPILYFMPLAVKSGENLTQIASISAYIRVFYEYLSERSQTDRYGWETTNNLVSSVNVDRGRKSFIMKFLNEEYSILSLCSLVLFSIRAIISAIYFFDVYVSNAQRIIMTVIYMLLLALAVCACVFIHKASSVKRVFMHASKQYVESYIKRAVEMGIIPKEEYYIAIDELDPARSIRFDPKDLLNIDDESSDGQTAGYDETD